MSGSKPGNFSASDVPDLSSRVAIVTGGNSGIGFETAFQLACHNARVYVAGRSQSRLEKAVTDMRKAAPGGKNIDLAILVMDLQSLRSVKEAADVFMKQESQLDMLINNAGIMAPPFKLTEDGFETQWQTNFLAGHLLFTSLLPILRSTAASSRSKGQVRVVNVSSDAALSMGPKELTPNDPSLGSLQGTMAPFKRYGHSKLASLVHAQAIHDRHRNQGICAFAVDPGIVNTNLQKGISTLLGTVIRATVRLGIMPGSASVSDGARGILFCATADDAPTGSGGYFVPYSKQSPSANKYTKNQAVVDGLWEAGENQLRGCGFERR